MRRILAGLIAFVAMTATLLVLPVYAAPIPEPEPVTTSSDEVPMGSVDDPAPAAEVQAGTSDPVTGVPATRPTLTVSRTDVAPFSLVGVTWAHDPAVADTVVQVRVRSEAGEWGGWTEVTPETADQSTTEDTGAVLRSGTSPLWTGPSTGVEVELVTRSGAQPTDVQLDLVDPGASEADAALGSPEITDTANAAAAMPPVFSRGQWGADEGIRTWAPQYAATVKAATLHHTADSNNYTMDQVPAIMRSIYRYHTVSLGWGDIGYNVIVDKFGRLFEGRAGGLASTVMGAHAGGFNTSTFGVSMLGNYDLVPVPQATVDAAAAIIAWKFGLFGIDPNGTTVLTSSGGGTSRYAAGAKVTVPTIFGHRDVGSTACPGRYGYARLGDIRARVTALRAASTATIASRYASDAGLRSVLGEPVGGQQTVAGVTWQEYQRGRLYSSQEGGVRLVKGGILEAYLRVGGPAVAGGPTTDENCMPGGCYNHFTRGSVYWSPVGGAHYVTGAIRDAWAQNGWERGPGWPTTDVVCLPGGCYTHFTYGSIYWSPGPGAHWVRGAIYNRWAAGGWERGVLGWPTSGEVCGNGGCRSQFTGGSLYWTPTTGPRLVKGEILAKYVGVGGEAGVLGWPTSDEICAAGGCWNAFTGGSVHWSSRTGTKWLGRELTDAAARAGGVPRLGFPTKDQVQLAGGTYADLESGSVYWSPAGGAHVVKGAIYDRWAAQRWENGPLGYPIGDEVCVVGGCSLRFAGGVVSWSPTVGTRVVKGAILDRWAALGGAGGTLGFPTTEEACVVGGCSITFEHGAVYWSPAGGARWIDDRLAAAYLRVGGPGGLGFPVSDQLPLAGGGAYAAFGQGSVHWSAATGAHVTKGAIRDAWGATGWERGPLGYPTSDEVCVSGGCYNSFAGGSVYWSPAGGARVLTGVVRDRFEAAGGVTGTLGFPVDGPLTVAGKTQVVFRDKVLEVDGAGVATVRAR